MSTYLKIVFSSLVVLLFSQGLFAQGALRGTITDATDGELLVGASILLQMDESARSRGITTNLSGVYEFSSLVAGTYTARVTYVGYLPTNITDIVIRDGETTVLDIRLERGVSLNPLVFSASRVQESTLNAPVSIESMDMIAISQVASDSYYKSLSTLKGVDMTTSSINFQIINSRGFNSTGNTRMVQLIDGMDTQAPALNFPIGNLNGPSELDVASIEYIPGAASALYGPNAFSGVLLINSKNPFQYPGTSAMVKTGINHVGANTGAGEPGDAQPVYDFAIRHAQVFNNRFAFKANFSYSQATDWHGIDFIDKNASLQGNLEANPAFDAVHRYGDDFSVNIRLLGINPQTRNQLAQGISAGTGGAIPVALAEQYVAALPSQPVNRTGYDERHLVDYSARNLKGSASLHYRLNEFVEASYSFNYGSGTSVYTGAQRYSLKNFYIAQHKLELNGDNFMVRAYGTFENSGDSYIADFVGFAVNDAYRDNNTWFGTYGATFAGALLQTAMQAQGGNPTYNQATVNAILSNPAAVHQFHLAARAAADQGRYMPGTPEFEAAKTAALSARVPDGALFDDQSRFYMVEGQYDLKNEITFADVLLGASFRQFQLRSNGTIFDDLGGVNINEYGAFMQASRSFVDDRLRLTAAVRYDKNENFDGQFSPRVAAVFSVARDHNLRASFQTGFRNPTTQGQYINLNVISARLLGGLPQFADQYNVTQSTYTIDSVNDFTNSILAGAPNPTLLVPYSVHNPVKPERIQVIEVGYKALIGNNLFFDAVYYHNTFNDFITQIRVRQSQIVQTGQILPVTHPNHFDVLLSGDFRNTFQIYTNSNETVTAHGAAIGFDYSLPGDYRLGFNYNWNKLISDLGTFQNDFNTPEHKFNISFGNRRVFDNFGFNVTYRWQDAFRWESSFVFMDVPAVSMLDAQITYRVDSMNSLVKFGGSNLLNNGYVLSGGGPNVGAIYYMSITYDNIFRR